MSVRLIAKSTNDSFSKLRSALDIFGCTNIGVDAQLECAREVLMGRTELARYLGREIGIGRANDILKGLPRKPIVLRFATIAKTFDFHQRAFLYNATILARSKGTHRTAFPFIICGLACDLPLKSPEPKIRRKDPASATHDPSLRDDA